MNNGAAAETTTTTPKIIREPQVYLVGRQDVDRGEIDRFLGDHGMNWETDTEVGGEQLIEAGGRLCYVSYGKGRKTNEEYIANIIGQKHGSVLEHAAWNFIITGVSRTFTHELIPTRVMSSRSSSPRTRSCTRPGSARSRPPTPPTANWSADFRRSSKRPASKARAAARWPARPRAPSSPTPPRR